MVENFTNEPNIHFTVITGSRDLDNKHLQVITDRWIEYPNSKVWFNSSSNIISVLDKTLNENKPDLFFIVGLYDWNYNFKPLGRFKEIPKIVSVRGMLHPGALSQKSFKKKLYLGMWKRMGLHRKVVFHATDEEEKKYVHDVFGKDVRVMVAGNFPNLFLYREVAKKEVGELKLVTVGLISPMKNIIEILKSLKICERVYRGGAEGAEVSRRIEYNIYGPVKDEAYWNLCLQEIKKMPANVTVNYCGEVPPEEIEGALINNHVFILPSKSENYGHAIVEALSAGRPVITSGNVPWVGLREAKAGVNVNMANEGQLGEAIEFFVKMNQEELNEWSRGARKYIEERVNVGEIKEQYKRMFEGV